VRSLGRTTGKPVIDYLDSEAFGDERFADWVHLDDDSVGAYSSDVAQRIVELTVHESMRTNP
jgi:hypothetical protein